MTCRLSPVLIVACRRDFLDAEIINFVAQLTPLVKQKLILSLISFKKRNERSTDSRIISICVGEVKNSTGLSSQPQSQFHFLKFKKFLQTLFETVNFVSHVISENEKNEETPVCEMVTRIGDRRMMTWCCLSHDMTAGKLALCVKMEIITFSTTEMKQ